jgi:hypothetical protein
MSEYRQHGPAEDQQFEALLPFFVTGALTPAEALLVNNYLQAHPGAQKSVDWVTVLQRVVKTTGMQRDPAIGLHRLLAALPPTASYTWPKRLWLKVRRIKPGFPLILGLTLLGGQGAYYLAKNTGLISTTTFQPAPVEAQVIVTLHQDADMVAVAAVVERLGGKVVASPAGSEAGKMVIKVLNRSKIPAMMDGLMESGLVAEAALL